MAKKVSAETLSRALSAELQYYDTSLQAEIQKAVDYEAKKMKKEIQDTSPVREIKDKDGKVIYTGGRYKAGWRITRRFPDAKKYTVSVHNVPRYNIVHLIENGRGDNHIGARPHIYKAHQKSVTSLLNRIDDIIGSW